jgi:hypothetical protein
MTSDLPFYRMFPDPPALAQAARSKLRLTSCPLDPAEQPRIGVVLRGLSFRFDWHSVCAQPT